MTQEENKRAAGLCFINCDGEKKRMWQVFVVSAGTKQMHDSRDGVRVQLPLCDLSC